MRFKRRPAYLGHDRRTAKSCCPHCNQLLSGAFDVSLDEAGDPQRPFKGAITVCAYCGEIAIFSDDKGHLRAMTDTERDQLRVDPDLQRIIDTVKAAGFPVRNKWQVKE